MLQEKKSCQICDGALWNKTIYLDKWNVSLFQHKSISICLKCGFGQINPKIDQNRLREYYENTYRSRNSPMHIDFNKSQLSTDTLDYRSISQLLLGIQYLNNKQEYRFLDIGSGFGDSFISARNILGNVRLFAIESNSDAKRFYSRYLNNISICEHLSEIRDRIDIVLMSHSLEHFDIDDMQNLFHDMHGVLGDNGIAIIEVPHEDLRKATVLNYRFNDTPHLSFFSLESLYRLVNKSKFELCFINTVGSLLVDSYSKETNQKQLLDMNNMTKNSMTKNSMTIGIKRLVRNTIRQTAKYVGLYDYLHKISLALIDRNAFYDDINFKYGGDRDLLRCVLRKK